MKKDTNKKENFNVQMRQMLKASSLMLSSKLCECETYLIRVWNVTSTERLAYVALALTRVRMQFRVFMDAQGKRLRQASNISNQHCSNASLIPHNHECVGTSWYLNV